MSTVGGGAFGAVDPAGSLTTPARRWSLGWWVGADDRWHVPATETSLRQRLAGPGVVETLVKVPGGDAVSRVFAAGGDADLGVIEVENASPLPFALALTRTGEPDVFFPRPPTVLEDRPGPAEDAVMLPVPHRATVRLAVALGPAPGAPVDPARLPSAGDAARAWGRHLEAGGSVALPDPRLQEAADAARASLLLFDDGVEVRPAPFTGPDTRASVAVLAALDAWGFARQAAELRGAVARRHRRRLAPAVLDATEAAGVVASMMDEASPTYAWAKGGEGHHGGRTAEFLLALRDLLVSGRADGGVALVPVLPAAWRGAPVEVHGLAAPLPGGRAFVSYAVRWHGDRPALIWEVDGPPVRLTAPALDPTWSTTEPTGEALLTGYCQ